MTANDTSSRKWRYVIRVCVSLKIRHSSWPPKDTQGQHLPRVPRQGYDTKYGTKLSNQLRSCLKWWTQTGNRLSADGAVVTGKKSGNHPLSGRADLRKHLLTAHSQVRLLPQPGRRIRELTGKSCLASCDFCLKMLFSSISTPRCSKIFSLPFHDWIQVRVLPGEPTSCLISVPYAGAGNNSLWVQLGATSILGTRIPNSMLSQTARNTVFRIRHIRLVKLQSVGRYPSKSQP